MGTCYSHTDSKKVRKINSNNKQRKSGGCLGSICNNSEISESRTRLNSVNALRNFPDIKSTYNIYYKDDKLNTDLNYLIEKYIDKLKIEKINFIQLYNIFMNYIYDFTRSNFIICDTREKANERNQNFLKKFHQINYSLKQLENMSDNRLVLFSNFLNNKNIIFILKEEASLDILEQYLIFFISNSNNQFLNFKNIYVLNEYIQINNEDINLLKTYLETLFYFIDNDVIYNYSPKILINSNDIRSSYLNYNNLNSNNSFIFINNYPHLAYRENNKQQYLNKFDINYLCNKNIEETDAFLNFIAKFNIYYILNFMLIDDNNNINSRNYQYITHSESKRNKVKNEEKRSMMRQKNITIPKSTQFEEFYQIIKNDFLYVLDEFKNQIIDNNCILIQFDDNIDNLLKYKLLYIIVFRITGLSFDDIYNYLKLNFFDIENEKLIMDKKDEIKNLLI